MTKEIEMLMNFSKQIKQLKSRAFSLCAIAAFALSGTSIAQTSSATLNTNIYLNAGQNYDLSVSNVNVYGNSQNEIVNLSTGVKNVVVDIKVESVSFPGGVSDYSFKADGSQVWVYKGSDLLVTVPIQTDTDGTQLTFFNSGQGTFTNGSYNGSGTYNATLIAGVVSIGGVAVSTSTPTALGATPRTNVYLSAGQNYDLYLSNVNVFGSSQNEIVNVSTGVKNVVVDINVESVSLPGGVSDYSFKADGSQVWVYKGSDLLVTVPIQTDTDGTQLTFFNSGQGTFTNGSYNGSGTYNATLISGVVYIGGVAVNTTTPTALGASALPSGNARLLNFSVTSGNIYTQYWGSYPTNWQGNWTAPNFTLSAALTDQTTIYVDARGQMNTDPYTHTDDGKLHTGIQNPAGILLTGSVASKPVGTVDMLALNLPNGVMLGNTAPTGALLIGNPSVGWMPVFSATSSNGLGSSNPPTTLTLSTTLRTLFGRELPSGTTLYFTYNDQDDSNVGAYAVSMSYVQSAVVTVPSAPTNVIASAGLESASVSFSAPSSNGGASITRYTVTASPGNQTATGTASPITVSGLSNGTAYTFKVFATNSAGQGASSVASNSVTPFTVQACPAVATAPAVPTAVSAVAGNASAVVSFAWSAGKCPQSLTGFTVKASPGGQTATGTSSPITISGLSNGTAYTFTVSSYNELGSSAASVASASVMPVAPSVSQIKLSLSTGWNLVGVGNQQALSVGAVFSDKTKVVSVWKWISNLSQWAFYTPSLSATELQAYALAKGYKVLDSIAGSDGFWINATQAHDVSVPFGTAYLAVDHRGSLVSGWNLVAVGEELTPVRFNNYLTAYTGDMPPSIGSDTTTSVYQTNLTSLWAWDAALSNWYFYAPSLDRDQLLLDYINSKHFLDFGAKNKKLSPGIGFWVNKN